MHRFPKIGIFVAAASLALAVLISPACAEVREYDVAVFGAGTGGMSAAIQAARCGASVAIIEPTDRVGGQITSSAVATMDDVGRTRYGIYLDFIERVRDHYRAANTATNICLWGEDTIAVEPRVADEILREMFAEAGGGDLCTFASPMRARVDERNTLREVEVAFGDGHENVVISADVFIDATEHGDLLALCGARYRVGACVSGAVDPSANVQDITYVAVVKRYLDGVPDELKLPYAPPRYDEYAPRFRSIVAVDGSRWGSGGAAPFDIPSHNAYRALPDTTNPCVISGGDSSTWAMITRTCLNWANDFPGHGANAPGLSVTYVEDADARRAAEREAMNKTLCFLWYMQEELGMTDWAIDVTQGYGHTFSNDWENADDPLLPKDFAPILKHFPPMPYVREARRIVGVDVLAEKDIRRNKISKRTPHGCPSSIAVGEYPVDVHGSHAPEMLEEDLGERDIEFPGWEGDLGLFGVPYGVLVPIEIDGLIAAEKNISVSRMVNGAIRLHPITMHTGQAAGAAAAMCASSGARPRDLDVRKLQRALIDSGQYIALDQAKDVTPSDPWWGGAQIASMTDSFARMKFTKSFFGASLPIDRADVVRLAQALLLDAFPSDGGRFVTREEFASYIGAKLQGGGLVSRGEAAAALYGMSRRGDR